LVVGHTAWVPKTPKTILDIQTQSEVLKVRIRRHKSSFPESIIEAIKSLEKGGKENRHRLTLLEAEVQKPRQTNEILSRRRRAKRIRLQKGGMMTVGEARDLIDQMDVDTQVVGESSKSGGQGRSA
jgi:hypothetical protein